MRLIKSLSMAMAALSTASAFSLKGGEVLVNGNPLLFSEDSVSSVALTSQREVLIINADLEAGSKPRQLNFILSDGNGADFALFPKYDEKTHKATAKLSVSKLPGFLQTQGEITVTLIAASGDPEEAKISKHVATLVPSDELKASVHYIAPHRLGPLPEIHHIFRVEEATVNAIVPVAFSAVSGVLLLVLLRSWATITDGTLFGAMQGSTFKAAFLATIVLFEVSFARYYLGTSIFATISSVALLFGPFLFFGFKSAASLATPKA